MPSPPNGICDFQELSLPFISQESAKWTSWWRGHSTTAPLKPWASADPLLRQEGEGRGRCCDIPAAGDSEPRHVSAAPQRQTDGTQVPGLQGGETEPPAAMLGSGRLSCCWMRGKGSFLGGKEGARWPSEFALIQMQLWGFRGGLWVQQT